MPFIMPQTRILDSVYSKEEQEKAINECNMYLNDKSKNITSMSPISIYYIIKSLNEQEQINFIKTNFDYIKQNDKDIFLYDIYEQPLCKFLSFKVIKEIYNLDKDIVYNLFSICIDVVVSKFKYKDILELYNDYPDIINRLNDYSFINLIYYYNRKLNNHNVVITNETKITEVEFLKLIMKKYKEKVDGLETLQFLEFLNLFSLAEYEYFKEFVELNKAKLSQCFSELNEDEIIERIGDMERQKNELLLSTFFEELITKSTVFYIIYFSNIEFLEKLIDENKISKFTFDDLLKSHSEKNKYNNISDKILSQYNVNELLGLEDLFQRKYYNRNKREIVKVRTIEQKYRNSLNTDGNLFDIDENTSIFSFKYLKNLNELKILLKNNSISKDNVVYQKHLKNFILYLNKIITLKDLNSEDVKEIEKLFYKIVKGFSITILYEISNIEDIAMYNRLGYVDLYSCFFTVKQIKKINVKNYKKLCNISIGRQFLDPITKENIKEYKKIIIKTSQGKFLTKNYRTLVLMLMLLVGYKHAKEILEIDNNITTLEHLVGSIGVKNIELDEQGNPILNKKIINLLFNSKENTRIEEMLLDKQSDLYTLFPRLFSEWEGIKERGKDKSLNTVLELLKSNDVLIPKEYYRLEGLFKYIGCSIDKVIETFKLHDKILEREETTIPKVSGKVGEYTYEILDLHDMYALTVGNRTNCCFTVKGASYSSLKHACTSKNGRILVIKKDDELVAHSWLWRNGNLLCLDNIEVDKSIKQIDFFDVYLEFADKIINKSIEIEGEESIENITIGHNYFDKPIVGIENYVSLVREEEQHQITNNMNRLKELPQPIEDNLYSDAKKVQYLIKGNGNFKLGQSKYLYKEKEKDKVLTLSNKCC